MDDLTTFINARLDEDEQTARRGAEVCGCHPAAPVWAFGDETTDGRILVVDDPHPSIKRKLGRRWNGSYEGLFAAEHIARHDPARVLRQVAAGRGLLRELASAEFTLRPAGRGTPPHDIMTGAVNSLRNAVRHLASTWSDHPDYRDEWRP